MPVKAVVFAVVQAVAAIGSAVYQSQMAKKAKKARKKAAAEAAARAAAMAAAEDARKGYEIAVETESGSLPLVYGKNKIGGVRVFSAVASTYIHAPYENSNADAVFTNSIEDFSSYFCMYGGELFTENGVKLCRIVREPDPGLPPRQFPFTPCKGLVTNNGEYRTIDGIEYCVYPARRLNSYIGLTGNLHNTKNELLFYQQVLCQGPINKAIDIIINDELYLDDPNLGNDREEDTNDEGNLIYKYRTSALRVDCNYNGNATQLITYNFPERSTANFTDMAYITAAVRLDRDFPQFTDIPDIQVLIEGRKVKTIEKFGDQYDVTTDRVYTNNPVCVLLDYLTDNEFGKGLSLANIDLESFYNAQQICDTLVMTQANVGGKFYQNTYADLFPNINNMSVSENLKLARKIYSTDLKLYECNLIIDPESTIRDNVETILGTMGDARLLWSQGKYKIQLQYPFLIDRSTQQVIPPHTLTQRTDYQNILLNYTNEDTTLELAADLTDDDLLLGQEIRISWPSLDDKFNHCTIRYADETLNFKENTASWPPKEAGYKAVGFGGFRYPVVDAALKNGGGDGYEFRQKYAVWSYEDNAPTGTTLEYRIFCDQTRSYRFYLSSAVNANIEIWNVNETTNELEGSIRAFHPNYTYPDNVLKRDDNQITLYEGQVYYIRMFGNSAGGVQKSVAGALRSDDGFEIWNTRSPVYSSFKVYHTTQAEVDAVYNKMLEEDGGVELETDIYGDGITTYHHAKAKAEELVRASRSSAVVEFKYILKENYLEPGDFIGLTSEQIGWSNEAGDLIKAYLRVNEVSLEENGICNVIGEMFDWRQLAWNVPDDQYYNPPPLYPQTFPAPTNFRISTIPNAIINSPGTLLWDSVISSELSHYNLYIHNPGEFDENDIPIFQLKGVADKTDISFAIPYMNIDGVVFGIRAVSVRGRVSVMKLTSTAGAVIEYPIPPAPTNLIANVINGTDVSLSWNKPDLRLDDTLYDDHARTRIYVNTSGNFENSYTDFVYSTEEFSYYVQGMNTYDIDIYYATRFLTRFGQLSPLSNVVSIKIPNPNLGESETPLVPTDFLASPGLGAIYLSHSQPLYKGHNHTAIYIGDLDENPDVGLPFDAAYSFVGNNSVYYVDFTVRKIRNLRVWAKWVNIRSEEGAPTPPQDIQVISSVSGIIDDIIDDIDKDPFISKIRTGLDRYPEIQILPNFFNETWPDLINEINTLLTITIPGINGQISTINGTLTNVEYDFTNELGRLRLAINEATGDILLETDTRIQGALDQFALNFDGNIESIIAIHDFHFTDDLHGFVNNNGTFVKGATEATLTVLNSTTNISLTTPITASTVDRIRVKLKYTGTWVGSFKFYKAGIPTTISVAEHSKNIYTIVDFPLTAEWSGTIDKIEFIIASSGTVIFDWIILGKSSSDPIYANIAVSVSNAKGIIEDSIGTIVTGQIESVLATKDYQNGDQVTAEVNAMQGIIETSVGETIAGTLESINSKIDKETVSIKQSYEFQGNYDNWLLSSCTGSFKLFSLELTSTSTAPRLTRTGSFIANTNEIIRVRFKFVGTMSSIAVTYGFSTSLGNYTATVNAVNTQEWQIITFDMRLNINWKDKTITSNYIQFATANKIEIDWINYGFYLDALIDTKIEEARGSILTETGLQMSGVAQSISSRIGGQEFLKHTGYDFVSDFQGFTSTNSTRTIENYSIKLVSTAANPWLVSPAISLVGNDAYTIRVKYKTENAVSTTAIVRVTSDSVSAEYTGTITGVDWKIAEWDLRAAARVKDKTITKIEFRFLSTGTVYIAWIDLGSRAKALIDGNITTFVGALRDDLNNKSMLGSIQEIQGTLTSINQTIDGRISSFTGMTQNEFTSTIGDFQEISASVRNFKAFRNYNFNNTSHSDVGYWGFAVTTNTSEYLIVKATNGNPLFQIGESFSASNFNKIKMRYLKVGTAQYLNQITFKANGVFRTVTDGVSVYSPADYWNVVTFDLSSNALWTGTITELKIHTLLRDPADLNKSLHIDWILLGNDSGEPIFGSIYEARQFTVDQNKATVESVEQLLLEMESPALKPSFAWAFKNTLNDFLVIPSATITADYVRVASAANQVIYIGGTFPYSTCKVVRARVRPQTPGNWLGHFHFVTVISPYTFTGITEALPEVGVDGWYNVEWVFPTAWVGNAIRIAFYPTSSGYVDIQSIIIGTLSSETFETQILDAKQIMITDKAQVLQSVDKLRLDWEKSETVLSPVFSSFFVKDLDGWWALNGTIARNGIPGEYCARITVSNTQYAYIRKTVNFPANHTHKARVRFRINSASFTWLGEVKARAGTTEYFSQTVQPYETFQANTWYVYETNIGAITGYSGKTITELDIVVCRATNNILVDIEYILIGVPQVGNGSANIYKESKIIRDDTETRISEVVDLRLEEGVTTFQEVYIEPFHRNLASRYNGIGLASAETTSGLMNFPGQYNIQRLTLTSTIGKEMRFAFNLKTADASVATSMFTAQAGMIVKLRCRRSSTFSVVPSYQGTKKISFGWRVNGQSTFTFLSPAEDISDAWQMKEYTWTINHANWNNKVIAEIQFGFGTTTATTPCYVDLEYIMIGYNAEKVNSYAALRKESFISRDHNNEYYGEWSVKFDINGRATGAGIRADANSTSFDIVGNAFRVVPPINSSGAALPTISTVGVGHIHYRTTDKTYWVKRINYADWQPFQASPFVVYATEQNINGVVFPPGMYVNSAFITRLTADKFALGAGTIDTVHINNLTVGTNWLANNAVSKSVSAINVRPGVTNNELWATDGSTSTAWYAAGVLLQTPINTVARYGFVVVKGFNTLARYTFPGTTTQEGWAYVTVEIDSDAGMIASKTFNIGDLPDFSDAQRFLSISFIDDKAATTSRSYWVRIRAHSKTSVWNGTAWVNAVTRFTDIYTSLIVVGVYK